MQERYRMFRRAGGNFYARDRAVLPPRIRGLVSLSSMRSAFGSHALTKTKNPGPETLQKKEAVSHRYCGTSELQKINLVPSFNRLGLSLLDRRASLF